MWKFWRDRVHTEAVADRQAFKFQYYKLTKRAIHSLKKHIQYCKFSRQLRRNRMKNIFERYVKASFGLIEKLILCHRWSTKALMYHTFRCLRDRIHIDANARTNGSLITEQAKARVLHEVFGHWRYLSRLKSHEKSTAQVRHDAILRGHLTDWRRTFRQRIATRVIMHAKNSRLLLLVWNSLKMYTAEGRKKDTFRRKSRRFRYFCLLSSGFTGFKQNKENLYQNIRNFKLKTTEKLQRSLFLAWKTFTLHRKRNTEIEGTIKSANQKALLKRIWYSGFVIYHMQVQIVKRKLDDAIEHYEHTLLWKTITAWSKWCRDQKMLMEAFAQRARDHEAKKMIQKREHCFLNWKEHAIHRLCTRHIAAYIRGRCEQRLAYRFLTAWKIYLVKVRQKSDMYQRAKLHERRTLLLRYFTEWNYKREQRIRCRKQLQLSLLHWKISLQRKIFLTWKTHISMKMEERARYHAALEFRHQYFIRQGLRLWFLAATGLQEQRLQTLEMVQAAESMRVWRKVACIARQWRSKTLRARERPNAPIFPLLPFAMAQKSMYDSEKQFGRKKPLLLRDNEFTETRGEFHELNVFPRARPRPRKPFDLLFGQHDMALQTQKISHNHSQLKSVPEPKMRESGNEMSSKCRKEDIKSSDRACGKRLLSIEELASRLEHWMRRKRNLIEKKKHVQAMTSQIDGGILT